MKPSILYFAVGALLGSASTLLGHDLANGEEHPHYDWSVKPPGADGTPMWFLAQVDTGAARTVAPVAAADGRASRPIQAGAFERFAPNVRVRWDARFLFVESNGLPAHNMMVGITNWQQQVPLPQNYTGTNAWQIPLHPMPAKEPASIKGRFLRGAIALAVNGIPIFNPQNNRGAVSAEIGELDQWGGHCGRADDYHYHAAPLHLQDVVGKDQPIAYALDGYPIYGLTEADGSQPTGLDAFNGHTTPGLGYHYHASTKYPYVNGGFHGEVVEAGGQVDPQPGAQPVRDAGAPLHGATITAFETTGNTSRLTYEVNGEKRAIVYTINADGTYPFEFQNGRDGTTKEVYTRRARAGGPGPGGKPRDGAGQREAGRPAGGERAPAPAASNDSTFVLHSSEVKSGGALPVDYTGDGSGATLPLEWSGAPEGTTSYALLMHHLDPEGVTKSYWILYNIPASVTSLPKNVRGVGSLGASFKGIVGYEPPHSKGPGAKTYVLTLYALSAAPEVSGPAGKVTYDVMLAAMKGKVLASTDLSVVYDRTGQISGEGAGERPPRSEGGNHAPRPPRDGAGPNPRPDFPNPNQ